MNEHVIETTHGQIAVLDIDGPGLPLVMIHANSVSKESFGPQFEALTGLRRMIAVDLPGHGSSSDAVDPLRTYSIPGYAAAVLEALKPRDVGDVIVLGHSLGGHVGLELIALGASVRGAFVFGTPPIENSLEGLQAGFKPSPEMTYTGSAEISDEQVGMVLNLALGAAASTDDFFRSVVRRTDGLARQYMIDAVVAGLGADQRKLAETSSVPLAIVNGANDPVINLDYLDGLSYSSLWGGNPYRIPNAGHAVNREQAASFNAILMRFLSSIDG
ncbi:alpha/beta fold hydrolase [Rhizobium bangladeshense]|uniref:alpha/beta fold hydrolase n=1 Tax=Rhizobium bangladeshense TaxID=1138189 RepID=UPI0007E5A557|nr:alpha/beta hydrolase [Rhizobium bangladeshense]